MQKNIKLIGIIIFERKYYKENKLKTHHITSTKKKKSHITIIITVDIIIFQRKDNENKHYKYQKKKTTHTQTKKYKNKHIVNFFYFLITIIFP